MRRGACCKLGEHGKHNPDQGIVAKGRKEGLNVKKVGSIRNKGETDLVRLKLTAPLNMDPEFTKESSTARNNATERSRNLEKARQEGMMGVIKRQIIANEKAYRRFQNLFQRLVV